MLERLILRQVSGRKRDPLSYSTSVQCCRAVNRKHRAVSEYDIQNVDLRKYMDP